MNCDKKFLGCCQLEVGGYALGLLHSGASVATLVLYLNHRAMIEISLWLLVCVSVFWCFHFIASVLLIFGTAKRKSTLIIPFIFLYTLIFTSISTFSAFCVLEGIASEPKTVTDSSIRRKAVNNSTEEMKRKMKAFKAKYIPPLELSGVNYAVLMLVVGCVCLLCVYILSCICSLYDKLKEEAMGERKSNLPLIGGDECGGGVTRESESDE